MNLKKYGLIIAVCLLVLAGCGRPEPPLTPALARVKSGDSFTTIPIEPYGDYLRVIGQLSVDDGRQSLMATAVLLHDLASTDFAPDTDYLSAESRRQLDERIAQDPGYGVRLETAAEAVGVTLEELYTLLSFDDLSQYAAQLMYDKLWTDLPDDDFIDSALTEEAQINAKHEACMALYNAYIDDIASRAEATDDPAVFVVDGEPFALEGDAAAFIRFCRYMTHIESIQEIMELTAFTAEMQKYGAAFDETAIAEEADDRVAQFYEQPKMDEWIDQTCATLGITRADFDASYRAMQQLSIRYAYCSDAFVASYEARPEAQQDMGAAAYYTALMAQLMAGSEMVDVKFEGEAT